MGASFTAGRLQASQAAVLSCGVCLLSVTFVCCVETATDTATVAKETVPKLSSGIIFNNLK